MHRQQLIGIFITVQFHGSSASWWAEVQVVDTIGWTLSYSLARSIDFWFSKGACFAHGRPML
jgi:hypothetical protein